MCFSSYQFHKELQQKLVHLNAKPKLPEKNLNLNKIFLLYQMILQSFTGT